MTAITMILSTLFGTFTFVECINLSQRQRASSRLLKKDIYLILEKTGQRNDKDDELYILRNEEEKKDQYVGAWAGPKWKGPNPPKSAYKPQATRFRKVFPQPKSDCFMLFFKNAPYGYDGKAILTDATVQGKTKRYELRNETFIPFSTEEPTENEALYLTR